MSRFRRPATLAAALVIAAAAAAARAAGGAELDSAFGNPLQPPPPPRAELVNVPVVSHGDISAAIDFDSLGGRSGGLRMRLLSLEEVATTPALVERLGDKILKPGVHAMPAGGGDSTFAFVTLTPWQRKLGSYVNGYHLGFWPGERRAVSEQYENPDGFIEVTPELAETRVSTHFTLRDFLTHDQAHVWPKYMVLRESLLDKLELVLDALQSFGVATQHVVVLSGFRSPQYNGRGAGEGMAQSSRHQFGDAADLIIDANRDGRMDDLNRDGRVDFDDTAVIERAVQLIEHKYPDLVGGLGLYREMGPSGPFVHIDVRGTRARWTNTSRRSGARAVATAWPGVTGAAIKSSGGCQAEGAMAVLCRGRR